MATSKTKPLGQAYYEEVEALKGSGVSNADAVRQVAGKYGKNENAVRGGIHQYKAKLAGGSTGGARRSRRSAATSVDDLVGAARRSLEEALKLVDREVEQAKAALDAAQEHYDRAVAGVADRKADIERKLKALT